MVILPAAGRAVALEASTRQEAGSRNDMRRWDGRWVLLSCGRGEACGADHRQPLGRGDTMNENIGGRRPRLVGVSRRARCCGLARSKAAWLVLALSLVALVVKAVPV